MHPDIGKKVKVNGKEGTIRATFKPVGKSIRYSVVFDEDTKGTYFDADKVTFLNPK